MYIRLTLVLRCCLLSLFIDSLAVAISTSTRWLLFENHEKPSSSHRLCLLLAETSSKMSEILEYKKGPICGIDNCPSSRYAEHDDGMTYCEKGHQRIVRDDESHILYSLIHWYRAKSLLNETKTTSAPRVVNHASRRRFGRQSHAVSYAIFVL